MEESRKDGISWFVASFLLMNVSLGAGLLNYPIAYSRLGGIVIATIIQIFVLILMATTMLTLVYCSCLYRVKSYHGVMEATCGKFVMNCSAASIVITCFGVCVLNVIIIGDQFDRILVTYINDKFCSKWFANRYFTMFTVSLISIWPLCYFKRIDFLKNVNLVGVISAFYIIYLYIYNFYKLNNANQKKHYRFVPDNAVEFIASLPIIFFSYQTHEMVIPIHGSMKDRRILTFVKSTLLALFILFFLYCGAGTYGYLTFGDKVAPDMMLMYDPKDPFVVGGIIAIIIKMITTYPLLTFCGRETIVRLMLDFGPNHSSKSSSSINIQIEQKDSTQIVSQNVQLDVQDSSSEMTQQEYSNNEERIFYILITTIWNVSVIILAIIIPNITVAIGFLGSLASSNVFIFPGLALMSLANEFRKNAQSSQKEKFIKIRANDRDAFVYLEYYCVQIFLMIYGLIIILMGLLMCFIVSWQMIRDLKNTALSHRLCAVDISFDS